LIGYNWKNIWLGRFDNEIEAARAYDEAAKKYHGEFARLNFSQRSEDLGVAVGEDGPQQIVENAA
jgi:hypothetical protein